MPTRKEMIDFLVERDIESVAEAVAHRDFEFLDSIIRGDGFVQYNNMSDSMLEGEYRCAVGEAEA